MDLTLFAQFVGNLRGNLAAVVLGADLNNTLSSDLISGRSIGCYSQPGQLIRRCRAIC